MVGGRGWLVGMVRGMVEGWLGGWLGEWLRDGWGGWLGGWLWDGWEASSANGSANEPSTSGVQSQYHPDRNLN